MKILTYSESFHITGRGIVHLVLLKEGETFSVGEKVLVDGIVQAIKMIEFSSNSKAIGVFFDAAFYC